MNNNLAVLTKSVSPLPSAYAIVAPVILKTKEFIAPRESGPAITPDLSASTTAVEDDYAWLRKIRRAIERSTVYGMISWLAYHADAHQTEIQPAVINAHSVAIIRHSIDVARRAVQNVNPGQIPVVAPDQKMFALGKQVQWTWLGT